MYLSRDSEQRARKVASERSQDWDAMTENEREEFMESVLAMIEENGFPKIGRSPRMLGLRLTRGIL